MRRIDYNRRFHRDANNLIELFALRASGISLNKLAERYDRDHATISFHLKKQAIHPFTKIFLNVRNESKRTRINREIRIRIAAEPQVVQSVSVPEFVPKPEPPRTMYFLNEPINPGKSYRQYLKEWKKRKYPSLLKHV